MCLREQSPAPAGSQLCDLGRLLELCRPSFPYLNTGSHQILHRTGVRTSESGTQTAVTATKVCSSRKDSHTLANTGT